MIAVDTNVVVRMLAKDDPRQTASARTLFGSGDIWISKTVLIETAWVLQKTYDFDEESIQAALIGLLGLANVRVEDEAAVAEALALFGEGLEFPDALHLCSRPTGAEFASFDKALVKRAHRACVARVRGL
jgi:predicted nucleic-acid-binding protein